MSAGAGKSANQISICGFPGDIAVCCALLAWLAGEINRFCELQWAELKSSGVSANAWKKSFRLGAVSVIGKRLAADREVAKKETTSTALVYLGTYEKQSQQAVTVLLTAAGIHIRKAKATSAKDTDGFTRGQEAGAQINLNAPKRALTV